MTAEQLADVCSFCDSHGLMHNAADTPDGTVLRILRSGPLPPPPTAEAPTVAAPTTAEPTPAAPLAAAPTAAESTSAAPPLTEAQRERAAANKAAAVTRRAASTAAAPAAAMSAAASAPLPAAPTSDQATVDELSGVADAAELRQLSDSLCVSTALYLGAHDMLKLRAMLEEPDDLEHAERVLRRLSMVPMTSKLDETTGFVAFMAELSCQETVQAAVQAGAEEAVHATALIARIVSTYERAD